MPNYLLFDKASYTGSTWVVTVRSAKNRDPLVIIKWFPRWRQYGFFPNAETVWTEDCLRAINIQLRGLQDEWRRDVRRRRGSKEHS